jgi:hypothetical protein
LKLDQKLVSKELKGNNIDFFREKKQKTKKKKMVLAVKGLTTCRYFVLEICSYVLLRKIFEIGLRNLELEETTTDFTAKRTRKLEKI